VLVILLSRNQGMQYCTVAAHEKQFLTLLVGCIYYMIVILKPFVCGEIRNLPLFTYARLSTLNELTHLFVVENVARFSHAFATAT